MTGAQVYGMDLKLPGMLNAAIKDCPVFGGKVKSFDAAAIAGRPGVKKVVRVGDTAVAVVADTWWRAKTALDALPIEWDEGPERQGVERDDRRDAEGRPRREGGVRRQQGRRRAGGARRRRQEGRGGVLVSVPEPRDDGADERDRALDAGAVRGLDADAERRGGARRGGRGLGPAGRQVRRLQAACWAAASAGAAQPTGCARRSRSRRRCRARRSS